MIYINLDLAWYWKRITNFENLFMFYLFCYIMFQDHKQTKKISYYRICYKPNNYTNLIKLLKQVINNNDYDLKKLLKC